MEEARKVFEDESRRNRNRPSSSTHHTNSLPRQNEEYTFAVYTFCDESMRYRTKIPGTQPTLKQFKEYLPKKGSFRWEKKSKKKINLFLLQMYLMHEHVLFRTDSSSRLPILIVHAFKKKFTTIQIFCQFMMAKLWEWWNQNKVRQRRKWTIDIEKEEN